MVRPKILQIETVRKLGDHAKPLRMQILYMGRIILELKKETTLRWNWLQPTQLA